MSASSNGNKIALVSGTARGIVGHMHNSINTSGDEQDFELEVAESARTGARWAPIDHDAPNGGFSRFDQVLPC